MRYLYSILWWVDVFGLVSNSFGVWNKSINGGLVIICLNIYKLFFRFMNFFLKEKYLRFLF